MAGSFVKDAVCDALRRVLPADASGRSFEPMDGAEPEELILGRLYRLSMTDPAGRPVTAQLYQGLGDFGGYLWEQDVRTLLRMNAIDHPALPTVLNGGHDPREDVGWVVTGSADYTLASPEMETYFPGRPVEALRHLILLADALALLHSQGIVHRSINPASLLVSDGDVEDKITLRLARFEMSAILQGILAGSTGSKLSAEVRRIQSEVPDDVLVHHAPERLDNLLVGAAADPEGDRSDVFSLGMVAFRWFVGSPASHAPSATDHGDSTDPKARRNFMREWHRRLVSAVTAAEARLGLPPMLAEVLRGMLDSSPSGRPTSSEVVTALSTSFAAIVRDLEPASGTPLHVMYMPVESRKTIYKWGWIANDPATAPGQAELHEWLDTELSGTRLLYSQRGAAPFVKDGGDDKDALLAAHYVLFGVQAAWFCAPFREKVPGGQLGQPWDELLLIKYVVPHHQLRGKFSSPRFARDSLDLELVSYEKSKQSLKAERPTWGSWQPLLQSVREAGERPAEEAELADGLQWVLQYRNAEIEAARFHYEIVDDAPLPGTGDMNTLVLALKVDSGARRLHLAAESLRDFIGQQLLDLGDYFEEQHRRSEEAVKLRLVGTGSRNDIRATYRCRLDASTICISVERRASVPVRGTIETVDNWGDRLGHQREVQAVNEMLESKTLVGQLRRPYTIRVLGKGLEDAGKGLEGGADEIVRRMLTSFPFFALQGPPGTGKTTVATHAILAQLAAEPTTRILVSAQSNGALDNLGLELKRRLSNTPSLMYRVQPRDRSVVNGRLSDLDLASVTEREVARIDKAVTALLRTPLLDPIRAVLGEWLAALPNARVEIAERIRNSANVVLATTAKSTRDDLDDWGRLPAFDWVVIEEAAKAWPTELAIPLSRGLRWTLIGDHRQLPAFRRSDFEQVLRDFAASDRPGSEVVADQADQIRDAFDLFASVFKRSDGVNPPVDSLKLQFRMRESVADIVSTAFYPADGLGVGDERVGFVETHPSAEARRNDLVSPKAFVGRPLVWVDTSGSDLLDEPAWANPGEAGLVHRIVNALTPRPPDRDLAILTPYTAQRSLLERMNIGKTVHTVHSYQGKEADIVVVSLVRTTNRGSTAAANIGFLADPQITNVMLSRAKSLLVLVGNLSHFEAAGDPSWDIVTRLIRERGFVVSCEAPLLAGSFT